MHKLLYEKSVLCTASPGIIKKTCIYTLHLCNIVLFSCVILTSIVFLTLKLGYIALLCNRWHGVISTLQALVPLLEPVSGQVVALTTSQASDSGGGSLNVVSTWQRIMDIQWIVGIVAVNNTSR